MSHSPEPTVSVCFASYNTKLMSELCVRSLRSLAGLPHALHVGDCDSNDGSIEMFEGFAAQGVLTLEVARGGRAHGQWLDHWLATVPTKYLVVCDSDVEFLERSWLRQMVHRAADTNAAVVATRIQAIDGVAYVHPTTGAVATLAARPEPWLMLLDVEQLRNHVTTSFMYQERVRPDGSKVAYDVAAAFYADVIEQGFHVAEMPAQFSRAFRHYSGLSWQRRGIPLRRQLKQLAKRSFVTLRWARAKALFRGPLVAGPRS